MTTAPEDRALPADPARANDYDSFAEAYTAENETSIWNAYYERPAMLPLGDGEFDDVVASLVLHYIKDWAPTLAELRRVLKPGGRLIASVDHPYAIHAMQSKAKAPGDRPDYFAIYQWTEDWAMGERTVPMRFWHRPLHASTAAFTAAGFRIASINEPRPVPAARELFPKEFRFLMTSPTFVLFVLEAG
ncbi:MAG TPA: class I SAM-dependent methyltransferase [Actinocrinis sp.]|jgi:SAM-dependent methyltransferase